MTKNGLEVILDLVRVILHSVMQAERSKYLQANAYERTEELIGVEISAMQVSRAAQQLDDALHE